MLDPRLETVNLGQGGYGLDQAYLWYQRAGRPARSSTLHLFAFYHRRFPPHAIRSTSSGYGKPLLRLQGDSIVVLNAPVPERSRLGRWWVAKGNRVMNLNIVQLANRVFGDPPTDRYDGARNDSTRTVVARIFQDLAWINASKNSRLVLVYLPGASDYRRDVAAAVVAQLRHRGGGATRYPADRPRRDRLRRVPPTQIDSLYLQDGHYSVRGNEFVARAIHGALAAPLGASSGGAAAH